MILWNNIHVSGPRSCIFFNEPIVVYRLLWCLYIYSVLAIALFFFKVGVVVEQIFPKS